MQKVNGIFKEKSLSQYLNLNSSRRIITARSHFFTSAFVFMLFIKVNELPLLKRRKNKKKKY